MDTASSVFLTHFNSFLSFYCTIKEQTWIKYEQLWLFFLLFPANPESKLIFLTEI